MSRVKDVPVFEQCEYELEARLYNLWRRAKLHIPFPIRISLPEFKGVVMILEEHEWVVVNEQQEDLPIIAWIDFEDHGRDSLHTPVKCKINYYHFAAKKLQDRVLEVMHDELEEQLGPH